MRLWMNDTRWSRMLQLLNRALLDMMGMMLLQHELASATFPSSRTIDSTIEATSIDTTRQGYNRDGNPSDHPEPVKMTGDA